MDIDLPWEFDPLREHPDRREFLMKKYIEELDRHGFNYSIVNGIGEKRLQNAINYINQLIK